MRETVIRYKNEDLLVERIIRLQRVGFGLTANDIRRMAFAFAVQNSLTDPRQLFSMLKKDKTAGWDWYSGFMERHQEISLRKSQAISFARAQCMNRPQLKLMHSLTCLVLSRTDLGCVRVQCTVISL